MIKVIGNYGCQKCVKAQKQLQKEGYDFSYRYLSELTDNNADKYMGMAREAGQQNFPIIIKDGDLVELVIEDGEIIEFAKLI